MAGVPAAFPLLLPFPAVYVHKIIQNNTRWDGELKLEKRAEPSFQTNFPSPAA